MPRVLHIQGSVTTYRLRGNGKETKVEEKEKDGGDDILFPKKQKLQRIRLKEDGQMDKDSDRMKGRKEGERKGRE
ncbi:hypothetical protein M0802_016603 [Mischocyttarus mexicanus]|nr:hypothetical protein M0802_016603 [Mischocyttarus mexicanus]